LRIASFCSILLAAAGISGAASVFAQPPAAPVSLLDVPYIQQTEALCAGAAAAMVMRYWGATGIYAESFAPLVDESLRGIRAEDLLRELRGRGWDARSFAGDRPLVAARLAARQPVVALIEDRPGYFHFVVVVAWVNGRVVYHDPARTPFRVVSEQTFDAAWQRSGRWTLLLLPGTRSIDAGTRSTDDDGRAIERRPEAAVKKPCDDLVAQGVRSVETGDRAAALNVFATAAELCPTASGPLRESAGVFALEGNWVDAARLADAAVKRDPADEHAWRILATSAYVRGDSAAALAAWNAVGEPLVDLVNVIGLGPTRHAVATRLVGIEPDTVLTTGRLATAARRLRELPSAELARVNYRPLGQGRATVDAVVAERTRWPTSRAAIASIGIRLLSDRELTASVSSPTGGGELLTASWRWWPNRPRVAGSYAIPSRLGVWRAEAFGEKQSYVDAGAPKSESRRGGSLVLSQWTSARTRWEAGAGIDAWEQGTQTVNISVAVDQRLMNDRIALRLGGSMFEGSFNAWTTTVGASWRSSIRHEGTVLVTGAGFDSASTDARLALWSGAGTGTGRDALLRAHPLLDDGRIDGEIFGRRLVYANLEAQRWIRPLLKVARIAPALFVDVASADGRLRAGRMWHADAGVGLRFALPGSNVVRLDVGKGLRDGATALSVGWIK
jgi:hypothetical protein